MSEDERLGRNGKIAAAVLITFGVIQLGLGLYPVRHELAHQLRRPFEVLK
jgi:hypothetical protein